MSDEEVEAWNKEVHNRGTAPSPESSATILQQNQFPNEQKQKLKYRMRLMTILKVFTYLFIFSTPQGPKGITEESGVMRPIQLLRT